MIEIEHLKIALSQEEIDILAGKQGLALQKVMETVVCYAEALNAEKFIDLEGPGHFVIPWSYPGIAPPIDMLVYLVEAGLKTKFPFTLDPRPPLDFENLDLETDVEDALLEMYSDQAQYDELLLKLGLRDKDAYTCNPYQAEIGNIPKKGSIVAWSESACAIYANSVLGARTNRNGAIMDLMLNIIGKAPLACLITDEGRQADWFVEINTAALPSAQLLGAAIWQKIVTGIPYITGLDRFLHDKPEALTLDYLQEMGSMIATYSAIDLFHVEAITPEALDSGRGLLVPDYETLGIDEDELERFYLSFPMLWDDPNAKPEKAYIGCPHLSLRQLNWWANQIEKRLTHHGIARLAVDTILFAAPQVLERFQTNMLTYQKMLSVGVHFSPACCETIFETGKYTGKPIATNSNKLRAYTSAKFFRDDDLLDVIVGGEV